MRFSEYLDRAAGLFPEHSAFIDGSLEVNYGTARDMMHRIANALSSDLALKAGTKIGVYSPNSALAYLSVLGLNRADMVWLPINYRNTLDTNVELLNFFDAQCLLYHSDFEDHITDVLKDVPTITTAICIDAHSQHGYSLPALMEAAGATHINEPEDPDADAIIMATGGTTGPSKGALQSHRGAEAMLINQMLLDIPEHPRYLAVAPITHAAGYFIPIFYTRGATTVILPGFEPENVLKTIEREKITHMFLPPSAVYALLDYPALHDHDFSTLKKLYVGSAPISPARFKQAVEVLGPCVEELYGQSEACFPLLIKSAEDYLDDDGNFIDEVVTSTGRANHTCWIEIMDDDGNILPAGEKGEIVVRNNGVMKGYYKNPEATAQVSTFGWHHTTDMGIRDKNGYITIVDRKKDMIISGGFNIFPVEIENVLVTHPAVHNCAVVGVPDPKWGEAVKAVIQLKVGEHVDPDELIALCKEKLGSVKAPKSVDFWDELPLSPVGKLLKRQVRDHFWVGQSRAVN